MAVAGLTLFVDVALSLWLKETVLAVAGLSLANSIAFTIGLALFIIRARGHVGALSFAGIGATVLKTTVVAVPVVAMTLGFEQIAGSSWWESGSSGVGFAYLVGIAGVLAIVVLGLYTLLKVEVVSVLLRRRRA
jgi:putative peptidoglycan lipid II flippase